MRVAQRQRPTRRKSKEAGTAPEAAHAGPSEDASQGARRVGALSGGSTALSRSKGWRAALHDLLRGLRAGDLECVLLTVAMAAEENRMPSADTDEAARILAFLTRLAGHEADLPLGPGVGAGKALDNG